MSKELKLDIVKWISTIFYMIGYIFSAFNIYVMTSISIIVGAIIMSIWAYLIGDKAFSLIAASSLILNLIAVINYYNLHHHLL